MQPPGSLNVLGGLAGAVGLIASLALLAAAAAVALRVRPALPTPRAVAAAAAVTVAATLVLGKVLSPQYLTWAVPLVAATGSLTAVGLVLGAAAISISWPLGWATPFDLDGDAWWAVARNALLVVLLAVLTADLRRELAREHREQGDEHEVAREDDEDDALTDRELGEPRGEPHPGQQCSQGGEGPGERSENELGRP